VTAAGVRAVLGVPVHLGGGPVGSLNVFRAVVHHWDDSDVAAITAFAHVVDHVLTLAVIGRNQDTLVKQLQEALVSRVKVERAVGVLMAVRDVDAPAAFELIRGAARSSRRRVQEVAEDIITRRGLPDGS
jgi:GAF domain-containing protein